MTSRTVEIFLTCCLDGDARVIGRILKKHRKSWTGIISTNSFNINCIDSSSRSGLMLACIRNRRDVVDLLLSRADLDVNMVDIFGATSLMYASKNGEGLEVVKLLLERKDLDLDEKDEDGKTAEDFATESGNQDILQIIREDRSNRMGAVWTRPETIMEENCSDSEHSLEDEAESDEEIETLNDERSAVDKEEMFEEQEMLMDENMLVKTEVIAKLNERMEKEANDVARKEKDYCDKISLIEEIFQMEKVKIEQIMEQKVKDLELVYLGQKKAAQDSFTKEKDKSDRLISKLQAAKENFDMSKLLQPSHSYSELECPVCLEEMKPPLRIWQCVSGHAVCEGCRKSPLVRDCPTCRQKIVGRNILAEKLARTLYSNEDQEK